MNDFSNWTNVEFEKARTGENYINDEKGFSQIIFLFFILFLFFIFYFIFIFIFIFYFLFFIFYFLFFIFIFLFLFFIFILFFFRWDEQRSYIFNAISSLNNNSFAQKIMQSFKELEAEIPSTVGFTKINPSLLLSVGRFSIQFDSNDSSISYLFDKKVFYFLLFFLFFILFFIFYFYFIFIFLLYIFVLIFLLFFLNFFYIFFLNFFLNFF